MRTHKTQEQSVDHEQHTGAGFEAVPDEDEATLAGADPGDDSDAPVQLGDSGTPAAAVRAENVTLHGGAQTIDAATVSIMQGGAGRVHADAFSVQQGGVGFARAQNLTVQSDASAFAVVADSATVHEGASVFMLLSRSVSGDVRPVLDWRAAFGLGAGAALVVSLLRRLR